MTPMTKFFGVLRAFAVVAIALSSGAVFGATDKFYTITTTPNTITGTSPLAVTATIKNTGNSSFNSFIVYAPSGVEFIAPYSVSRGTPSIVGSGAGNAVKVIDINLPASSANEIITLTVTMRNASTACPSNAGGPWGGLPSKFYTGTPLSGSTFALSGTAPSTTVSNPCYTVTGQAEPSAGGSVTCASPVPSGGSSLCTATVTPGYTLVGLSANCGSPSNTLPSTANTTCTVSGVTSTQTVTATYKVNVTVNQTTGGTVACDPNPVPDNTSTTCTATPAADYRLKSWNDACGSFTVSTGAEQCTLSSVTSPKTVSATFQKTYTVTGSPITGNSTVTCVPGTVDSGSSSTCTFSSNDSFLKGFSSAGSTCAWSGSGNSCTVDPVTANTTVTGSFILANTNGKIGCVSGALPNTTRNNYNSIAGPTDLSYDPDGTNVPDVTGWGLRRGANYVASDCVLVNYNFNLALVGDGTVASLLFDRTTGQAASWKYRVIWPTPIAVDSTNPNTGWTTIRPRVSWGIDNPDNAANSPDFVPALFCLNDPGDLSQRTVQDLEDLKPTMPNDCGANACNSSSGDDGPFAKAYLAHPLVYPLGGKAKMCISGQFFTPGAGNKVYQVTEFVDLADGFGAPR